MSYARVLILGVTPPPARAVDQAAGAGGPRLKRPQWRLVRDAAATPDGATSPVWSTSAAEVIAHDTGPLLVRGGPGTGKTSLLVASVAARVAAGAEPSRVVVLTFGR